MSNALKKIKPMHQLTIEEFNAGLKIVKFNGEKFAGETKLFYYQPEGYGLKHDDYGYVCITNNSPYAPKGGKKALEALFKSDNKGFVRIEGMVCVQPIQNA